MVILSSCGSDGEKLKRQQPQNTKYVKRRKVFVVRDFPKAFEQFSTQTNRIANESFNSVSSDEDLFDRIYVDSDSGEDSSEPFEIDVSVSRLVESGADSLKLLESAERDCTDIFHDNLVVAHTKQTDWGKTNFPRKTVLAIRSFPPKCGRDAKHLSNEDCHIAKAFGLDCNKSSVENEPFDEDDSTEPSEFEVGDRFSHEDCPSLVKLCTESFPKICAPQIRVSAIRFFPPGCGRNAIYPSKEDSEKALDFSKNKGTCHEERSIRQAPGENSIENDFPLASSSNIESESIDTMKNRVKPTHSSNLYQSQIKSQTIGDGRKDRDVEYLSKKPKKYLTKTKLSRVSTNMSEFQGKHRVIVQALMAAPTCSSRKGIAAFKTQLK